MKICIVSQYFPPRVIGGGEYAAYTTARALAKHGHSVHILTSRLLNQRPSDQVHSEVPVYEVKDRMAIHRILGVKTMKLASIDLTCFCVHEFFFLHAFFAILGFVKTKKPDVVHALNIDSIPPSVLVAKICRIPVIVTINSHAVTCPKGDRLEVERKICKKKCTFSLAKHCFFDKFWFRGWRGLLYLETFLWWSILKFFIRYADKIIAISKHIQETLIYNKVQPEKIVVIPEIADSTFLRSDRDTNIAKKEFGFSPSDKIVLYAGAVFDSKKGSDVLIKAIPIVLKRMPNVQFVMTGTIPDREMKIIEDRGLGQNVVFMGFLPRKKMSHLYAAADVIVFPSVWPEPFGLVLTEAMSMKKPVIASKVGGIPDIIDDEKNGVLVDPNDANRLAIAIIRVLNDEKLAKRLGQAGRETVKRRFCEKNVVVKIVETYRSSLKQ